MSFDIEKLDNWYFENISSSPDTSPFSKEVISSVLKLILSFGLSPDKLVVNRNGMQAFTDFEKVYIPSLFLNFDNLLEVANDSQHFSLLNNTTNYEKSLIVHSLYSYIIYHEKTHIDKSQYLSKMQLENSTHMEIAQVVEDIYVNYTIKSSNISEFRKIFYSIVDYKSNYIDYDAYIEKIKRNEISKKEYLEYLILNLHLLNYNLALYDNHEDIIYNFEIAVNDWVLDTHYNTVNDYNRFKQALLEFLDSDDFVETKREFLFDHYYKICSYFMSDEQKKDGNRNIKNTNTSSELSDKNESIARTLRVGYEHKVMSDTLSDSRKENVDKRAYQEFLDGVGLKILDVLELSVEGIGIKKNIELEKFSKNLKYLYGVDRKTSPNYSSGPEINDEYLVNSFVDGKIFKRDEDNENEFVKSEVVVCVDFSFSMEYIIREVLSGVSGLCNGLRKSGLKHSLWGHTTISYERSSVLFNIYSFNMKDANGIIRRHSNYNYRINRAMTVGRNSNEDYLVIDYLCNNAFIKRQNKVLIMASDGTPSRGREAIYYTKKSIENARKKGVRVYSLSLTEDVVADNNGIYGEDFNLVAYGEHLNDASKKISHLLMQKQ